MLQSRQLVTYINRSTHIHNYIDYVRVYICRLYKRLYIPYAICMKRAAMLYVRLPLNWVSRSFGLASFCYTLPSVCVCVCVGGLSVVALQPVVSFSFSYSFYFLVQCCQLFQRDKLCPDGSLGYTTFLMHTA